MKVSAINGISRLSGVKANPIIQRLDAVRKGLRQHGQVIVNLDNKVDQEVISRLKKIHGDENVQVERSSNAKLTVKNFKR